jgi:hypothetical protein
MHPPVHRAVSETSIRGLGSSAARTRMRGRASESPVSIREAFPSPGGKHPRPKNARPNVKQRMTALRTPIGAMGLSGCTIEARAP